MLSQKDPTSSGVEVVHGFNPATALADFGFIAVEDIQCVTNDLRAVEAPKQVSIAHGISIHEFCKSLKMLGRDNVSLTINSPLG